MTRKPGRPQKTDDETAVVIRLEKRHVDMLDEHIERQTRMEGGTHNAHQVGARRRQFLGELIEKHLSFEAQHPTQLSIYAPIVGGAREFREAAEWLSGQEGRLLEDAPEPIKAAIETNKLVRLRDEDPTRYREMLRKALANAKEREDDD